MGVVLKLEGGKKMTLPAMGTGELGGAILVEDRKHALLIEQLTHHWKMFEEHGSGAFSYNAFAPSSCSIGNFIR